MSSVFSSYKSQLTQSATASSVQETGGSTVSFLPSMLPLWRRSVLPLLDRATHRTACGGPGFSDAFLAEKSYWEERYRGQDSSRNHFDWLADSQATLEQVLDSSDNAQWYSPGGAVSPAWGQCSGPRLWNVQFCQYFVQVLAGTAPNGTLLHPTAHCGKTSWNRQKIWG